jgi:L-ascorbate oxidase
MQDWYHLDGPALQAGLDSIPFIWLGDAQSFLINGGGLYLPCYENTTSDLSMCASDCTVDNYIKTIDVESGKTYRLRIIGGQILVGVNFAIHGHNMTVVEVDGVLCEPFEVSNLDVFGGQRYSVLVTMDQDPGSYFATTSVRYRSSGPNGWIVFKYSDSPETNFTLNESHPDHPEWNDTEPTLALEEMLVPKNIESYSDYDVLSADAGSVRRVVMVVTQATDSVSGMLRWALNNVTHEMPAKPVIYSAYESVHEDGAEPWPDTTIPDTVVLPEDPPTPWNYTEPVHDSVGSYNGEIGPSIIQVTGEYLSLLFSVLCVCKSTDEMTC